MVCTQFIQKYSARFQTSCCAYAFYALLYVEARLIGNACKYEDAIGAVVAVRPGLAKNNSLLTRGTCLASSRIPVLCLSLFRSDCVMHAYGCDSVLEDNCILIQGRSVDSWEGVEVPEVKGWRHARMDIRAFRAKFEVLSPTSACTSIVTNVDLKAPLPQAVVNFLVSCSTVILGRFCLQQIPCTRFLFRCFSYSTV